MPQRRPRFDLRGEWTPQKVEQLNQVIEELYSLINLAASHPLLDGDVNRDTRPDIELGNNVNSPTLARGDLISGQNDPQGRPKWQRLAVGQENTVLRSDGTDPQWDKVQLPNDVDGVLDVPHGGTGVSTLTDHAVLLGNGANDIETVSGVGTAGQHLTSNGAGLDPTWQSTEVDDLADVVITTPTDGDVLTYDSGSWVNSPATGGSGTDHVVLSDGVPAGPTPVNDGAGNFIYIPYVP